MNVKKKVMRRMATLLIASLTMTGSAFTVLAESNIQITDTVKDTDYYSLRAQKDTATIEKVGESAQLVVEVFKKGTAASTNDAVATAANAAQAKTRFETTEWESSDDSVVSISEGTDGFTCTVTGKKAGTATITFTSDFEEEVTFTVTVKDDNQDDNQDDNKDDNDETKYDEPDDKKILDMAEDLNDEISDEYDLNTEAGQQKFLDDYKTSSTTVSESVEQVKKVLGQKLETESKSERLQRTFNQISERFPAVKGSKLNAKISDVTKTLKIDRYGKPVSVISKMIYNIGLFDKDNKEVNITGNTEAIKFRVPLPSEGIYAGWWALVKHNDQKFSSQVKEDGNDFYIDVVAWNFSDFELEFSENKPENVKTVDELNSPDDTGAVTTPSSNGGGSSSGGSGGRSRVSSETTSTTSQNRYAMTGSWTADANGWKFVKSNGETATNTWGWINNQYYYFDASGRMVTGWVLVDGNWYYMNPAQELQGAMLTGVIFDPAYNAYFYADASGAMVTGWQQVNGKWYYFNPVSDGVHTQGQLLAGTYVDGYYLGADGAMVSGN